MRVYYPVNIIVNTKSYYCLWYTHYSIDDEPLSHDESLSEDGLITELYKVKSFSSIEDLRQYVKNEGVQYKDEEAVYDINVAVNWLKSKKNIDCNYFLNFWNMTADIANSLKIRFEGNKRTKHINKIYDKLFWGCNLPAVTPEGCEYIPIWRKKEMRIITKIVKYGIEIIKNFVF